MKLSNIAKKLTVATLLAVVVAPLATGCAVAGSSEKENVAAVSSELSDIPIPDAVLEKMAKELTKAALGGDISATLFGDKEIDVDKLLANIDAATRQAIFEYAMENNKAQIDTALEALQDYEQKKNDIGKPRTQTAAEIYADMSADSNLKATDYVRNRLAKATDARVRQQGLALYAEAVQTDANRLMLMILLRPDIAGSNIPTLKTHLRNSSLHVRTQVNAYRESQFEQRLGSVGACKDEWEYKGDYINDYVAFRDGGSMFSRQDAVGANALARCDADRDGHIGRIERQLQRDIDAKFALPLRLADEWLRAADALENTAAAQTSVVSGLDFGGMWGYIREEGETQTRVAVNPFTGGASCPTGYAQVAMSGKLNVDYPAYACVKPGNGLHAVADFGGMYGDLDYRTFGRSANNPFTGSASCPTGFTSYKILGDRGADGNLSYCAKAHTDGATSPYTFGGTYSRVGGFKNTMTAGMTCSAGFTPTQVWGSNGTNGGHVDQEIVMCGKNDVGVPIYLGVNPPGDRLQGTTAGEGAPGYTAKGASFTLAVDASDSRTPLYRCRMGAWHFLSTASSCEGQAVENDGQPLGFLEKTQVPGTVAVTRLRDASGWVHVSTTTPSDYPGFTAESVQGYAKP